jgi:predicted RNA-binding Zn-ribbon protein involved in translation (DUF1610 family)
MEPEVRRRTVAESKKLQRIKELYPLVLSCKQTPPPKQSLFSWKCPKCGNKLAKESINDMIFSGEGAEEFIKKVISDAGLEPGLHKLLIDHLTCKCGYEFAKEDIGVPSE